MVYGFVGFGILVESILPMLLSVGCFLCTVFSFLSLHYDLRDGGAPHMSTCTYICRRTCGSQTSVVLPKVMIIGVGLRICMPMGTHHWMSMGRVG